jgi:hypothetical protein
MYKLKVTRFKEKEPDYADYICKILFPGDNLANAWYDEPNNRWVLGHTNDWFMRYNKETQEISLNYRYDCELRRPALEGLIKYLEWKLN